MSLLTAQLVTAEAMPRLVESMRPTPEAWVALQEEDCLARRRGQELRFLQACYQQAEAVLPGSLPPESQDNLRALFERLRQSCEQSAVELCKMGGSQHITSVPKYYYSEMRRRRNCVLPQPPDRLNESELLAFLTLEVAGALRRAERYSLMGKEGGAVVPKEQWEEKAQFEKERARDTLAVLFTIFDEDRVEADLKVSICREGEVSAEMLDDSQGRVRFGRRPYDDGPESGDEAGGDESAHVSAGPRPVFIVSDCTGESASHTVRCALGQLGHCFDRSVTSSMTTFRFVVEGEIDDIVEQAKQKNAFIVYTLVDPIVNAHMVKSCEESEVECHDLWGSLLQKMEGFYHTSRTGMPGRTQAVDDNYMALIDCIEYTRTLDDGVLPDRWKEADILILGPSRTGKTPLSFFMSQRGFKVANYPIVPDEELPRQLWNFDQRRVFALTIDHEKLANIRSTRMKSLNMGSNTQYAQKSSIQKEIQWCQRLYRKNPQWNVIDATYAGVEESSATIMRMLYQMGYRSRTDHTDNPSAI